MKLRDGSGLKAEMEKQGMSYRRLARYAGCSPSFISHLTAGRKTTCTPKLAKRIVEGLGHDDIGLFFEVKVSSVTTHTERPAIRKPPVRAALTAGTEITPVVGVTR